MTMPIDILTGVKPENLSKEQLDCAKPYVLKGFVDDWPIVQKAKQSTKSVEDYLRECYQGKPVVTFGAESEHNGRYFYTPDFKGFNFVRRTNLVSNVLDLLAKYRTEKSPPSMYIGSTTTDSWFPRLAKENQMNLPIDSSILPSIWIGNNSRIAAHYDFPDNIACVASGKRRFTLFPPEQISNLYVGPIDFTPAGQQISLVDFQQPDHNKFPKFKQALANSYVFELEAGDAIFIPSMWWHHVESLGELNILMNYWWRSTPSYLGNPQNALLLSLMSLKDLPVRQKQAWKAVFDYLIFDNDGLEHIPKESKGCLDQLDETMAKKMKSLLINKLTR